VPKDIFNHDADLHYTLKAGGCVLYSVGKNGKDDGGRGLEDHAAVNSPAPTDKWDDWDDFVVRMVWVASDKN
jgi:hypothetical protein